MRVKKILLLLTVGISTAGCSSLPVNLGPKVEVSSYSEKTFILEQPIELEVKNDFSKVEVYGWDKGEIKFEITKKIRGIKKKSELEGHLKEFNITTSQNADKFVFTSQYKGSIKGIADKSLDLKIFVPLKIRKMSFAVDAGSIKFYDDIKGELNIRMDMANIDIGRFIGKLDLQGNMGNFKLDSGRLEGDSLVKLKNGNIDVKAEYENIKSCRYETEVGNIDLRLPSSSKVFVETIGELETNEFSNKDYPAKINASSKLGRISVRKY